MRHQPPPRRQESGSRFRLLPRTLSRRPAWGVLRAALLALALLGSARAQDTEGGNPTGPSGDFNGEVTTGGSYDPYTGNLKRQVTDLVVPGSNGAYPLAFSRTANSNLAVVGGDYPCFGEGGNWRHSYQWAIDLSGSNGATPAASYTVAYPSGAVVTFRPGRTGAPTGELPTFWRGPSGTADRLEVQSANYIYLHTADGGIVYFNSPTGHPTAIVDPNGAVTRLAYVANNPNYLEWVYEPGGRSIHLVYQTVSYRYPNGSHATYTLLNQAVASTGQTATYDCEKCGSNGGPDGSFALKPYYALFGVSYDAEASTAGGSVRAAYTYTPDPNNTAPPLLTTATDPHYAGAMVNIRYALGAIEEQNQGTSERVSRLDLGAGPAGTVTNTETRGDRSSGTGNTSGRGANLTRTFRFGQANPSLPDGSPTPAAAKPSALTSVSDFEAYTSYQYYYDASAKDTEGKGYLSATLDAGGAVTHYHHEPLTGRTTAVVLPDGRTRTAAWGGINGDGRFPYLLQSTTDERGFTTTYRRDPNQGGLVYQLDHPPGGGSEYFSYQAFSGPNASTFYKLRVHTTPLGAQTIYGYDETDENHGGSGYQGLLTSVTRYYAVTATTVVGERTKLYYDALDRVVKSVDPLGVTTLYEYNARHQLTRLTHAADGTFALYGYDDFGNRTSVQDENGHTVTTTYDEYRRVTSVTVPVNAPMANGTQLASRYRAFAYDRRDSSNASVGTATSHTGANWSVSWLPSGSAVQRLYSPNNWLTDESRGMYVNWNGATVTPTPANGYAHTTTTYNALGQPVTTTDAQGFATGYGYDNCHRLSATNDQMGHATTRTYYANGEPSVSANNRINCAGLLKSVQGPGTDLTYQPTVTTQYSNYDPLGRLTETIDPLGHVFSSAFDPAGDLTSQSDGAQATGYVYDQLGRKTALNYPPGGGSEGWTYDAGGNLKTYTNRAGAVCTYQYDGRNRCSRYDWSDGTTSPTGYAYDVASRVIEVANWSADVRFAYDDSGALRQETAQLSGQAALPTGYTHDYDGNVDSITYPNGNVPCFSYDSQERCTGMYSNGVTYSAYVYSGDWLIERALYNGFYTTYGHQNNGRVSEVWHRNGSGANVSRRGYGYAPDGQVSWFDRELDTQNPNIPASGSSLENGRGDAFLYWPDGSLGFHCRDMAVVGGWPQAFSATADSRINNGSDRYPGGTADAGANSYQYDQAGNRSQTQRSDRNGNWQPAVNYAPDSLNRYPDKLGYGDGQGNVTQDYQSGWSYGYNAENKLTGATGPNGQSLALQYDGLGRLVRQSAGDGVNRAVNTLFYYAGHQRIEERNGANAPRYLYFFDAPGSDQLLWREGGPWGRLWYQTDLLGNTTHLSAEAYNSQGQLTGGYVVEQYLYDAYGTPTVYDPAGNARPGGSLFDNRSLFKSEGGYQWLSGPGLYHCRARMYLPQHGRWLQPDPLGQAGGLNLYAYCHNDPVNGKDPSGLADTFTGSNIPGSNAGNFGTNIQLFGTSYQRLTTNSYDDSFISSLIFDESSDLNNVLSESSSNGASSSSIEYITYREGSKEFYDKFDKDFATAWQSPTFQALWNYMASSTVEFSIGPRIAGTVGNGLTSILGQYLPGAITIELFGNWGFGTIVHESQHGADNLARNKFFGINPSSPMFNDPAGIGVYSADDQKVRSLPYYTANSLEDRAFRAENMAAKELVDKQVIPGYGYILRLPGTYNPLTPLIPDPFGRSGH